MVFTLEDSIVNRKNPEDGEWGLNKNYVKLSEHNIPIPINDFEDRET